MEDENVKVIEVHPESKVTAIIGEVNGHFMIWHMNPGHPAIEVTEDKPLVIRIEAKQLKFSG